MKARPFDKTAHLRRSLIANLIAFGALLLCAVPGLAKGGALDQSFAKSGIWTRAVQFDKSFARPPVVAGTPDGGAVALVDQGSWAKVFKLGPSGRPDPAFGTKGQVQIGGGASGLQTFRPAGIVSDSSGRYVVAGTQSNCTTVPCDRIAVVRLLPDGTLDPSFGTNGVGTTDFGLTFTYQDPYSPGHPAETRSSQTAAQVALDGNGRIVVSGRAATGYEYGYGGREVIAPLIARFTPTGQPDTSFGTAGAVTFPDQAGEPGTAPTDLSVDGGDRILFGVCAGQRNGPGRNLVVRLLPSGARDSSFGSGGLRQSKTCPEAIATGQNQVFVLRPSDEEMISGPVDAARTLEAWKLNGRIDSSFGKHGRVQPGPAGTVSMFAVWQDLIVDRGGHVVMIGELERPTKTGLVPNALIATRLFRRGRPAPGFGPKGRIVTRFGGLKLSGEGALGLSREGLPLGAVGLMGPEGRTSLAVLRYRAS